MSYISDWLASDGGEEAYRDYQIAARRENTRDRYEREHEFDDNTGADDLIIDYESEK